MKRLSCQLGLDKFLIHILLAMSSFEQKLYEN